MPSNNLIIQLYTNLDKRCLQSFVSTWRKAVIAVSGWSKLLYQWVKVKKNMQQLKTRKYSQPYPQQGLLNIGKIVKAAYDRSQMTLRDFSQMVCEKSGDEKALDKDTLTRLIRAGEAKGSKGRDFWRLSAIAPFTLWEEKKRPFTEEELYAIAEGLIDPFTVVRKSRSNATTKKPSEHTEANKENATEKILGGAISNISEDTEIKFATSAVQSVRTLEKPPQMDDRVPERIQLTVRQNYKLSAILAAAVDCDRQTIGKWTADRGMRISDIIDILQPNGAGEETIGLPREILEKLRPFLYRIDFWLDEGNDNWRAVLRRPLEHYLSLDDLLRDVRNGLRSTKA